MEQRWPSLMQINGAAESDVCRFWASYVNYVHFVRGLTHRLVAVVTEESSK